MIWYLIGLIIGLAPLLISFKYKRRATPIEDCDYTSKIFEDLKELERQAELERLRMKCITLETYREMEQRKDVAHATPCCGIEFLYPRKTTVISRLELPEK